MLGVHEALNDCGLELYEVNGQRAFALVGSDGTVLSQSVSYLRKQVQGQDGPVDGPMPLDPPITRLKGTTVCAVVFSINETYESAMVKLAAAAQLLEAA